MRSWQILQYFVAILAVIRHEYDLHAIAPMLFRNGAVDIFHRIGPDQAIERESAGFVQGDELGNEDIGVAVAFDDAFDGVAKGDDGQQGAGYRCTWRRHADNA